MATTRTLENNISMRLKTEPPAAAIFKLPAAGEVMIWLSMLLSTHPVRDAICGGQTFADIAIPTPVRRANLDATMKQSQMPLLSTHPRRVRPADPAVYERHCYPRTCGRCDIKPFAVLFSGRGILPSSLCPGCELRLLSTHFEQGANQSLAMVRNFIFVAIPAPV